jgi:hypothetical protein
MRVSIPRMLAASYVLAALGAGVLLAEPPEYQSQKKAQAAILNLSENLEAKDVADRAKKIVAEHDSADISSVFARKERGGLGIGELTQAGHRDSIEYLINILSRRKTTTEADLERYQADYLRVAKVMQAMAELAPHRGTPFVRDNPERLKEWLKTAADFKSKTAAFRAAVEDKDPKKVRITAMDLHHTCCDCHNQT